MTDAILALNAGSSSFKFAVAPLSDVQTRLLSGTVERIGSDSSVLNLKTDDGKRVSRAIGQIDHRAALEKLFQEINGLDIAPEVRGVGHRIVHGGTKFTYPVPITPDVLSDIEALIPMAPLHQPHGLRGVLTAREAYPEAVHVACFDSAFHANKPWVNDAYALPRHHYDQGIRRYGFHGIACESICDTLTKEAFPLAERRIVIAHLGNGCSVTAVDKGRAVATSMGFSTLDGLTMGTRCGSIDPGVLIHLVRNGCDADDLENLLYYQSGLLGLSGLSNDMRDLAASDEAACREAIAFFVSRLVEEIGRLACAMGGLDNVVFSGGIGENATDIRDDVAERLSFLPGPDGTGITYLVRPADEEQHLLSTVGRLGFGIAA